MAKMLKSWFLGLVCLGWISWAGATPCAADNSVCQRTLNVLDTCTSDKCECSSPDTMTAVRTGCAVNTGLAQPVVTLDEAYSGDVEAGTAIELTCSSANSPRFAGLEYAWFVNDEVQASETSRTFTITVSGSPLRRTVKCKVSSSGLESESEPRDIIGYIATGSITSKPVIKEHAITKVVDGQTLTLTCINLPKGNSITPEFEDTSAGTSITPPVSIDPSANDYTQKTYTCRGSSSALSSDPWQSPSGPTAKSAIDAVEIYSPSESAITLKPSTPGIQLKCRHSDQTLYAGTAITYKWQLDDAEIDDAGYSGVDSDTLTLPSTLTASPTAKVYKCIGTDIGAGDPRPSATISVTVADLVAAAHVEVDPSFPLVDGYVQARCLIVAPTLEGLGYSWLRKAQGAKGFNVIAGQTDNTLQINQLATGDNGDYRCTLTNGYFSFGSESGEIDAQQLDAFTPTLSSSLTTPNYGTGEKYTLTCNVAGLATGITFKWFKNDDELSVTAQTLEITATSTSATYKCQAIKADNSGGSYQSIQDIAVQGKDFTSVVVTGIPSPLTGTTPEYTCTATKATGVIGDVTYQWKVDGSNVPSEGTSSTYTMTEVTAGKTYQYTCEVQAGAAGTAVASSQFTVTPVAALEAPTVTVNAVGGQTALYEGGSYTLICASPSYDRGETVIFDWQKDDNDLSATTLTYGISAMADDNAGLYKCKITVNGEESPLSDPGTTITMSTAKGRVCTSSNYKLESGCADRTKYDGNCIAGRCTCATNVTLYEDTCGEERSAFTEGAGNGIKASVTFLVLGLLIFVTFG